MATSVHASISLSCCLSQLVSFISFFEYSGLTLTVRVNRRAAPFLHCHQRPARKHLLMPTFHTPFAMHKYAQINTYGLRRIIYLVALQHEESAT